MPFTLSHPAAILPLVGRLGLVGSALAVGSTTPDLPYFFGLDWPRPLTHSAFSVLWWSIPAGLAVWLTLQHLVRAPAIFLLPPSLRARIPPEPAPLRPLAVPLSLALGAVTHLLWDLATHETGMLVAWAYDPARGFGPGLWTRLLQHGSTLLGALAIAWWIRAWVRRTPPRAPERAPKPLLEGWRQPLRVGLGLLALAGGLAVAVALAPRRATVTGIELLVIHAVVGTVSSGALLLVGLGAGVRLARDRVRVPGPPSGGES